MFVAVIFIPSSAARACTAHFKVTNMWTPRQVDWCVACNVTGMLPFQFWTCVVCQTSPLSLTVAFLTVNISKENTKLQVMCPASIKIWKQTHCLRIFGYVHTVGKSCVNLPFCYATCSQFFHDSLTALIHFFSHLYYNVNSQQKSEQSLKTCSVNVTYGTYISFLMKNYTLQCFH